MGKFKFLSIVLVLILESCYDPLSQPAVPLTDTAVVINYALTDAIADRFMPEAQALKSENRFNDSILLTSSVLSLSFLPTAINGQRFKVMTPQDILRLLMSDSTDQSLPNYLNVSDFEKTDTDYYVQVQNMSVLPFGGGGLLGLHYVKEGDSLICRKRSAWSIN